MSLLVPQVRDLVDDVVVVTDQEIVGAMQLVFERMKLVVEPSGAAGLAAVLTPAFTDALSKHSQASAVGQGGTPDSTAGNGTALPRLNIGIILCGGNLDFASKGFFGMGMWKVEG